MSSPIPTQRRPGHGSPNRYTSISGASHLLFLTQGYAIIDDPTMPIVGPGETANDTYVQQLVASAQAAVDKAVRDGRHRSRSRGRRRPQLRRLHDRQPAGALRHLPRRHRAQRRLQPHADAVRLPERTAHVLGSAADLRQHVAVLLRQQDQRADPADSRRGRRQQRHVPDPVRALLHGAQGPRRDRPLRDACPTKRTATPHASRCCTPLPRCSTGPTSSRRTPNRARRRRRRSSSSRNGHSSLRTDQPARPQGFGRYKCPRSTYL